MKQSTVIFGALLLGFIIYITVRGQLPAYMNLFTGNPAPKARPKSSTEIELNKRGISIPDFGSIDMLGGFDWQAILAGGTFNSRNI